MNTDTCRKSSASPHRAYRGFFAALVAAWIVAACGAVAVATDKGPATKEGKRSSAVARVRQTVEFLASDEMQGRGLGTKGLDRAAEYIRDEFVRLGLRVDLCDGGAFQAFTVPVTMKGHRQSVDWWAMISEASRNKGASTPKAGAEEGGDAEVKGAGPPLRSGPGTQAETKDAERPARDKAVEAASEPAAENAKPTTAEIKNVVAELGGSGPLADETIVIGAHYDHLGEVRGDDGKTVVYNGANDNASGTAALIEAARILARREKKLPRRIVFVAFSGEEQGLLGSLHYVGHPPVPLDKTIAMINLDMVGQMENRRVMAIGLDSSPSLADLADRVAQEDGVRLVPVPVNIPASDHAAFYSRGIPVIHLITLGGRGDYHRPSDDAKTLNYKGIAQVARMTADLAVALAETQQRPEFASKGFSNLLIRGVVRFFGEAAKQQKAKPGPADGMPKKEKEER